MHSSKTQILLVALAALFLTTGASGGCGGKSGPPPPAEERSWESRVEGWLDGQYCDYSTETEYYEPNSSYEPHDFGAWEWPKFQPSSQYTTQHACVSAECVWVDCFVEEMQVVGFNADTLNPEKMCNNFQGPWKDKCEFDHYVAGPFAFSGPEEECGFVYPECPEVVTNNCFCGEEAKEAFYADWCESGDFRNWCPATHQYNDGRSQPCVVSGYTFSPQNETINGTWHPMGADLCNGL